MRTPARVLSIAIACSAPLLAQAPQPPVFRAGTDMVEVDVIARDKNGTFVSDLTIDDFELREDGKPRPLQQLYLHVSTAGGWDSARPGGAAARPASPAEGRAPHFFVVVFDDAHLTPAGFKHTQAAALALFQTQLRDGDIGGVVSNGRMANGRLTSDRAELVKAVKDAKPNAKILSTRVDEQMWPRLSAGEAVRIAVNDDKEVLDMAVRRGCSEDRSACEGPGGEDYVRGMIQGKAVQSSTSLRVEASRTLAMLGSVLTGLGRLEGPKNVLLMTEGFISEETWSEVQDAVGSAARSNTRIYTLDARGLGGRGMASIESVAPAEAISRMYEQMDMEGDAVNSLAVDTGGFVVRNTNQFERAISQIADDAGNYYVLGYVAASPGDGKFHRIGVKVKRPGVRTRARRGFLATPRPEPVNATGADASVRLKPDTTETGSTTETGRTAETALTADTTVSSATTAPADTIATTAAADATPASTGTISTAATASPAGAVRMRPDAGKHIDMLLPDPASVQAAATGWAAYQRGDVTAARASLSVAAASPSAEAWVHYALGQAEYALGHYAAAVSSWEKVHAAARTFEPVYFDLVDGYLQLKEHDKAIRLLREGAAGWPEDPDMFNALGVVNTSRGALDEAIAAFQDALKASTRDAVSYFNLGRAYELRYFRTRRFFVKTQRWIANEKDRTAALENYERYLAAGGPYADAAQSGVTRLKWAAAAQ